LRQWVFLIVVAFGAFHFPFKFPFKIVWLSRRDPVLETVLEKVLDRRSLFFANILVFPLSSATWCLRIASKWLRHCFYALLFRM